MRLLGGKDLLVSILRNTVKLTKNSRKTRSKELISKFRKF